ncbi:hypothetical protein MAH1_05440 [Sessilibacter sp. MAH1]
MNMSAQSETESLLTYPYPWHQAVWQKLEKSMASDKLVHAILVAGPAGIGKQALVTALAHRLLCTNSENGSVCGVCKGCQLNAAQTHPDLKFVMPEEKGKAIKIEQVRELNEFFSKTAQQLGKKIAILGPVENLNLNSANALLKTLEEPTSNSHLLLFSHQLSGVLATIRSRTQLLSMPMPTEQESVGWLETMTDLNALELLEFSGGAPLRALEYCDVTILDEHKKMVSLVSQVYDGAISPLLAAAQLQKQDLQSVLTCLLNNLDSKVRSVFLGGNEVDPRLTWSLQKMYGLRDIVIGLSHQITNGANPNKQLALEEIFYSYAQCGVNR